jgi:uncharacterized integral membrane protein (TIGR00697 family)
MKPSTPPGARERDAGPTAVSTCAAPGWFRVPTLAVAHLAIIVASNYFVQWPLELFGVLTTWGAFTFPLVFVATDLTVRLLGQRPARRVVARVMGPALLASYVVSVLFQEGRFQGFGALAGFDTFVARIALASLVAYVVGQLVDIAVFDRLRRRPQWWLAPAASTVVGDAFMAEHWVSIALVDYATKLVISLLAFLPLYRALLEVLARPLQPTPRAA